MKFKQLDITGFKSFSEKTTILIEEGLTGIVGPNGCGKSNIVESLRWCMGENSAKSMRGSGMEDVIFSGTSNKPSKNISEVTLLLDNQNKEGPSHYKEFDEISVRRKIERDKGSKYYVNGKEVRARDVQTLFADLSTGAHSPSLISSRTEENTQVVVCTTLPPIKDYGDIDFYLENTRKNLELALTQPHAQLYFTAKEVPLYRYMDQPGLSAFRYYLWVMENMRRQERFDPLAIPQALIHKGQELTKLSECIKSTEFWVAGAFDNLIGQIRYVSNNSRMSDRVKNQLKEELHAVLDKLLNNILSEQTKEGTAL